MKLSILNAGQQTDYLYGFVYGLSHIEGIEIEVVDAKQSVGVVDKVPKVKLFNLRGDNISPQSVFTKAYRILLYYLRLFVYVLITKSKIFHIQWENNSIAWFDRTLLILFYKILGKKLVYTAHNVYKEARDGKATRFRWFTLKIMYELIDRIIVHTSKMKSELQSIFKISEKKIFVIPHGINIRVQRTGLTQKEARYMLSLDSSSHAVLFFGQIDEYKGVDLLVNAVNILLKKDPLIVLLIAGSPKRYSSYVLDLKKQIFETMPEKNVKARLEYIPVDEVETYFMAADCLVLPYKKIFQSGVIFLSYRFGTPIIATDVGSFREDIIDGKTGFICKPDDAEDLASKIYTFFKGDLYKNLEQVRKEIIDYAEKKYSWIDIGKITYEVYRGLITSK